MTRYDIDKLFALLRELHPSRATPETEEKKYAWLLALAPYSYSDARAAALRCARTSNFYPSPSDIATEIERVNPSEQDAPPKPERSERKRGFARYARQLSEDEDGRISVSRYAREHGLSWEQAKREMVANGLYVPA